MKRILSYTALCCTFAFGATPGAARATEFDLFQFMNCYNLIVLDEYNSQTDVEGRTFVGGNMNVASANLYILPEDAPQDCAYPELLIAGDMSGSAVSLDNGGNMVVGGSVGNTVNMNGGGSAAVIGAVTGSVGGEEVATESEFLTVSCVVSGSTTTAATTVTSEESETTETTESSESTTTARKSNCGRCLLRAEEKAALAAAEQQTLEESAAQESISGGGETEQSASQECSASDTSASGGSAAIESVVRTETTGLSQRLASMEATDEMTMKTENNTGQLIMTSDADIAVFEMTLDELTALERIEISAGSADAIVINVTGTDGNITMDFVPFSGEGDVKAAYADKLIWNFPEATELNFEKAFFGSVIAPGAHGSNQSNINGTVVFDSFTQGDEIHVPSYAGPEL